MPLKTAVLALHFQNDVLHENGKVALGLTKTPDRRDTVITAAMRLLQSARSHDIPVISVAMVFPEKFQDVVQNAPIFKAAAKVEAMVRGSWGAEFFPPLAPKSTEIVVTHSRINAFYLSSLAVGLSELGAEHLVLAGIATNSVVEHTARHAADMGYRITVAENACGCAVPHLHDASLENMAFLATICKTEAIIAEWERSWS